MSDAEQYEYDLFLSYSSHDKASVRGELPTRIEEAGVARKCRYDVRLAGLHSNLACPSRIRRLRYPSLQPPIMRPVTL